MFCGRVMADRKRPLGPQERPLFDQRNKSPMRAMGRHKGRPKPGQGLATDRVQSAHALPPAPSSGRRSPEAQPTSDGPLTHAKLSTKSGNPPCAPATHDHPHKKQDCRGKGAAPRKADRRRPHPPPAALPGTTQAEELVPTLGNLSARAALAGVEGSIKGTAAVRAAL